MQGEHSIPDMTDSKIENLHAYPQFLASVSWHRGFLLCVANVAFVCPFISLRFSLMGCPLFCSRKLYNCLDFLIWVLCVFFFTHSSAQRRQHRFSSFDKVIYTNKYACCTHHALQVPSRCAVRANRRCTLLLKIVLRLKYKIVHVHYSLPHFFCFSRYRVSE